MTTQSDDLFNIIIVDLLDIGVKYSILDKMRIIVSRLKTNNKDYKKNYLGEYALLYNTQINQLLNENEKLGKQLASALNSLECPMLHFDLPDNNDKA